MTQGDCDIVVKELNYLTRPDAKKALVNLDHENVLMYCRPRSNLDRRALQMYLEETLNEQ